MATKTRQLADFLVAGGVSDAEIQSVPHIRPGILQPAVAGKDLSGTALGGSYVYGTAHTDGHSYYYTDIKGSKPIKDPRIGAHFGSQRHKFRSMQKLEQETAMAGHPVSSVDGREWVRTHGASFHIVNDASGNCIKNHDGAHPDVNDWIEITGYFNKMNWLALIYSNSATDVNVVVDGVSKSTSFAPDANVNSPLNDRYVDGSSLQELPVGTLSLGIHTVKIGLSTTYWYANGCELIAQDTTSTANKSKIQIPSQNVVSYGKKFTVADTPHYNPFAFKTDGTTAWASGAHNGTSWPVGTGSSANIDTATSLGLENWKHSNNYYKPYNGGRVVVWVASDGTIKTSVNVMPPNARSIGNSASLTNATAKANASIANNTFYPTMEAGTVDHSLAEVAKTFHWREFGNGAANGGTGATYADASMLDADDDISYVMDDGLTSFSAKDPDKHANYDSWNLLASAENAFYTFIGTGFAIRQVNTATCTYTYDVWVDGVLIQNDVTFTGVGWKIFAQNLPYGTHIIKFNNTGTSGAEVATFDEVSFHQPKMPPIPEDAVVIADYMLMADFVPRTANGIQYISKGVRYMNPTRDYHYNYSASAGASSGGWVPVPTYRAGFSRWDRNHNSDSVRTVTCFGNSFDYQYYTDSSGVTSTTLTGGSAGTTDMSNHTLAGAGAGFTSVTSAGVITKAQSGSEMDNYVTGVAGASAPIGVQVFKETSNINSKTNYATSWAVHTPIHTSSHYQTFETPYLHELVGGDRNMEQTNLVVTPDGKTWDEVTRDTSYIGVHTGLYCGETPAVSANENIFIHWDAYRGGFGDSDSNQALQKNFAIAYDRIICLEDGWYTVSWGARFTSGLEAQGYFKVNNAIIANSIAANSHNGDRSGAFKTVQIPLKRGDYLQISFTAALMNESGKYNSFQITKID